MNFFRNEKGQSFSVFKLLISAIVALAILGILLTLIYGPWWDFFPKDEPAQKAGELVQKLSDRGGYERSSKVTFDSSKKSTMLSKEVISIAQWGVANDKVCLSLGDFADSGDFAEGQENGSPEKIALDVTGKREATLSVLCDSGTLLEQAIEDYSNEGLKAEWIEGCPCTEDEATCCLVALRYSK